MLPDCRSLCLATHCNHIRDCLLLCSIACGSFDSAFCRAKSLRGCRNSLTLMGNGWRNPFCCITTEWFVDTHDRITSHGANHNTLMIRGPPHLSGKNNQRAEYFYRSTGVLSVHVRHNSEWLDQNPRHVSGLVYVMMMMMKLKCITGNTCT
jgi:hypothetical protein